MFGWKPKYFIESVTLTRITHGYTVCVIANSHDSKYIPRKLEGVAKNLDHAKSMADGFIGDVYI